MLLTEGQDDPVVSRVLAAMGTHGAPRATKTDLIRRGFIDDGGRTRRGLLRRSRAAVFALVGSVTLAFAQSTDSPVTAAPPAPLEERFHIGSKPFSEAKARRGFWSNAPYRIAFARYPDFGSCGSYWDQTAELNWEKLANYASAEVCIFHLAEALGTPDDLAAWLNENGFRSHISDDLGMALPSEKPPVVHASVNLNAEGAPKFLGLPGYFASKHNRSVTLGVRYHRLNTEIFPKSVSVGINWN